MMLLIKMNSRRSSFHLQVLLGASVALADSASLTNSGTTFDSFSTTMVSLSTSVESLPAICKALTSVYKLSAIGKV